MSFTFNFAIENEDKSEENNSNEAINNESERNGVEENDPKITTWRKAKEHFLQDSHLERISSMLSIEHFDTKGSVLNFVNSESVSKNLISRDYSGDLTPALNNSTDLVSGVYEGGLKIWECSEDLVEFLHDNKAGNLTGLKVLELGCGAALPGIYCFTEGASVWFNDYNEDVINEVTVPNMLLNVPTDAPETRFFSGDWKDLESKILEKEVKNEEQKFDLILTSETIYNVENQKKLISIFRNYTKVGGEILVAAKSFYFGVGGGVRQFEGLAKKSGLNVTTVKKYEEGVTREILRIVL